MHEAFRLPRITPIAISESVIDRISSVFYPHAQSHRPEVAQPPPVSVRKVKRKTKKSKSTASLDAFVQAQASRLLANEQDNIKLVQYKLTSDYEKKHKNYSSVRHEIFADNLKVAENPEHPSAQRLQTKNLTASRQKSRAYSSLIKQKEDSLKNALTVQKPKIQTVESRIKTIVQHIFPVIEDAALSQFIEKFDEMVLLVKKSKDEERKVDKLVKSQKVNPIRKVEILQEKKKKLQAQLDEEYNHLIDKFLTKDQKLKENEETFKKKFRKQLKNLSKTMILDKII